MRLGFELLVVLLAVALELTACVPSASTPTASEPLPTERRTGEAMETSTSVLTEAQARQLMADLAPRLSGHLAYWFGWFAFFQNTLVYEGSTN